MPYLDKPPLLYAFAALAFALGGEGEGTARAVPALAGLLAVGATAWLGARLLGGRGGFVAGAALLTSAGFFAFSRYVRPETLFVASLAGGFALALTGLAEQRRGRVVAGLALFGIAALAKDPLGALAPPLVIGLALALAGRARPIGRWLPWPGLLALVVLAFGWWLLAEIRTPGFVWYTVVDNHVLNAVGARRFPDEDVPLSADEFLAVGLMGAAPWIIPAVLTVWSLARRRAWREPQEMPWVVLGLWAVGVFATTALSSFRLPHYGLPAYFAIALLAARGWEEQRGRGFLVFHAALFAAFALACGLAWGSDGARFMDSVLGATDVAARKSAAAGQAAPLPAFAAFRPLLGAAALVFAAGALALGLFVVAFNRVSPLARRLVPLFAVAAVMLAMLPSVSAALSLVVSHRSVSALGRELGRRAGAGDVVVHEGPIENSGALEWYSGRRPVIVDGRRSVLAFGALRPEARDVFRDATWLRETWLSGRRVWVVSVRSAERSIVASLPGARLVGAAAGRSLWVNEPR